MKLALNLLGIAAIFSAVINVNALDLSSKTYVDVGVGGSIAADITSKTSGGKISFDPGMRADVAFGYRITDPLAVELQTGFIWNSVDQTGGVKLSSLGLTSDWYQVPILVNLIYTIPLDSGIKPYIGIGAGGVASSVDLTAGSSSMDDSDIVFGWQGIAGVKYAISEQMDVGVAYKVLGTTDHDFSTFTGLNDSTVNHSFLATFTYKF